MKFSNEEIWSLAYQDVLAPRSQRALVADQSPHFGFAKMFDGYSEGQVTEVFRSLEEAAAWLDVPVEVAAEAFEEIRRVHKWV